MNVNGQPVVAVPTAPVITAAGQTIVCYTNSQYYRSLMRTTSA
ncbi:MAG: hypothetical protein ACLR70_03685 [Streptococcus thermophilus]